LARETSTSTDPRSSVPSALETSPATIVGTGPPNVALIAGLSALGAMVLLGLIGAAVLLQRRRNQKQSEAASASSTASNTAQYGSVLAVLS
jgi:hypothetical protein